jgi:hypothetical protein
VIGKAHLVRIRGFDGKRSGELPLGRPLFEEHRQALDLPLENSVRDFQIGK